MARQPVAVTAQEALSLAPAGFFAEPPDGHFWLEHLVRVLAARGGAAEEEADRAWQFLALAGDGEENLALYAVNTHTRYAMFHATEPRRGGALLAEALSRFPPEKVLANYGALDAAVRAAGLEGRIVRDHRELFLILPCGELGVEPDWRYRLAGLEDIPRLEAYNRLYNAERATNWRRDWHRAVQARSVYVGECDGVIASCLIKGALLPPLISCGGVFTFPEFRGRGEATRLVANFCAEMALSGLDVCLLVDDDNLPALRVYGRVGFRPAALYRTTYFA